MAVKILWIFETLPIAIWINWLIYTVSLYSAYINKYGHITHKETSFIFDLYCWHMRKVQHASLILAAVKMTFKSTASNITNGLKTLCNCPIIKKYTKYYPLEYESVDLHFILIYMHLVSFDNCNWIDKENIRSRRRRYPIKKLYIYFCDQQKVIFCKSGIRNWLWSDMTYVRR